MTLDSDQLNAALAHHQAGRFEEAQQAYLALRASDPDNATVLSLLGAVNINLRQFQVAADFLSAALAVDPNHQAAHDNLGVLLGKVGRFAEAADCFRRAVELNPDNSQTQLNLGAALVRAGQNEAAIEAYRTAARLTPDSSRAHAELAKLLMAAGRPIEAVPAYRQLARLKPGDPKAQFELAAVLAHAGQTADAILTYQEVLRLKPDSAESCVNLAQLHIAKRDFEAGESWARRALELRPEFAEAHLNLASALTKLNRLTEAKTALFEAIRLKPQLAQSYNNLGIVLSEEGDFEAAIAAYRQSLALDADNADTIYNLGLARFKQGQLEAAVSEFDRALVLRPNYAEAHHNRASGLLLLGQWETGFAEYEWRFRSRDFPPFRPRWKPFNGGSPEGRTIVLVAEQGLGDTLQFIRYARLLADQGARVLVECPKVLHPILARTAGVEQWISGSDPPPEADGCIPLLSMPLRSGTTLENVPIDIPYVLADHERTALWKERLAVLGSLRVGIVWQGNSKAPGDAERSIPLACYEPLARVPGVRLVSLQKGPGVEQLDAVREAWNIVDFGAELDAQGGAFMDTAAILQNLDLLITSDTAAAHLAGALGVTTWVALQRVPDWRWLLEREDSPWYPTMRLFRQPSPGDWSSVFQRMAEQLSPLAADK